MASASFSLVGAIDLKAVNSYIATLIIAFYRTLTWEVETKVTKFT